MKSDYVYVYTVSGSVYVLMDEVLYVHRPKHHTLGENTKYHKAAATEVIAEDGKRAMVFTYDGGTTRTSALNEKETNIIRLAGHPQMIGQIVQKADDEIPYSRREFYFTLDRRMHRKSARCNRGEKDNTRKSVDLHAAQIILRNRDSVACECLI